MTKILREKYAASKVIAFGSFARKELNECSDIDLVIVGDFKDRFHKRIAEVIGLVDLPIEPLCYTEEEFGRMLGEDNPLICEVQKEGIQIL